MTTFSPPLSPSHLFTIVAVLVAMLFPHVDSTTRLIIIAVVVVVYVIAETIYRSIRSRRLELPALTGNDLADFKALLSASPIGSKVLATLVTQAAPHPDAYIASLEHPTDAMTAEVHDDTSTALALARKRLAELEAQRGGK